MSLGQAARAASATAVAAAMIAALAVVAARPAHAADFVIEPADSRVTFSALQQGARFPGSFERFGGQVSFDPATGTGRIDATVDVASVDTGNPERDGILKTPDWFDTGRFPQARFVAERIRREAGGFVADGTLALRDLTQPATLRFDFTPATAGGMARLAGTLVVKRLDFGIGRGEWTDTSYVGNDVDVAVDVRLRPVTPPVPHDSGAR